MSIGPALVLSLLVGTLDASLYVLLRGSAGGRLVPLVAASILGAWAGDALMGRLGVELITIGDYHLVGALVMSWIGIGLVSVLAVLGPTGVGGPRAWLDRMIRGWGRR